MVFYSKGNHFNTDYLPYVKEVEPNNINGAERLVNLVKPHVEGYAYKPMYFAEAQGFNEKDNYEGLEVVILQNEKHASDLYDLLYNIEEFTTSKDPKDEFIASKMNSLDTGPSYLVYDGDNVVSTVAVTAETSKTGMVIGVATHPSRRGEGLASKLMTKLMEEYFNKNKYLCLFYDNP